MGRDVAIVLVTCIVLIFTIGVITDYDILPRALGLFAGTVLSGLTIAFILKQLK